VRLLCHTGPVPFQIDLSLVPVNCLRRHNSVIVYILAFLLSGGEYLYPRETINVNFDFITCHPDGTCASHRRNRDLSRKRDVLGGLGALQGGPRDGGRDHKVRPAQPRTDVETPGRLTITLT
jgi:hypothetical protein